MSDTDTATYDMAGTAVVDLVAKFIEAKRVQDNANALVDSIKSELADVFDRLGIEGAAKVYNGEDVILTRSVGVRTSFDAETLRRLAPAAAEAATRRTEYMRWNLPRIRG